MSEKEEKTRKYSKKEPGSRALKKSRLIVRNLSFKCSPEELKKAFSKYGEVANVSIPLKPGTDRRIGPAFVQFTNVFATEKALKGLNGQPIKGRPVSLDWVVQREVYLDRKKKAAEQQKKQDKDSKDSGSDSNDDDEEGEGKEGKEEKMDDGSDSEDDSDADDGRRSGSEEEDMDDSSDEDDEKERDSDDEDFDDEEDEDDEEGDGPRKRKRKEDNRPKQKWEGDATEGRTLFIRNVSFDSEAEDLKKGFSRFGDVHYARVLVDYETEQSRGMAFVQFKTKEGVDSCMEAVQNQDPIRVHGRDLIVALAVTRDSTSKFQVKTAAEERKDKMDTRNLYLAREGVIFPNSDAAKELSTNDMAKRRKAEMEKKAKLANPNFFVSKTRLCIRNIPRAVSDEQLKKVFATSLGESKRVRIKKVMIMRDLKNVNAQGVARPRGFGFVEFEKHEDAMEALRATNNNPAIFGKEKRLIVEFSIEDRRALHKQELRRQKASGDYRGGRRPQAQQGQDKRPQGKQQPRQQQQQQKGKSSTTGDQAAEKTKPKKIGRSQRRKLRQQEEGVGKPTKQAPQLQQADAGSQVRSGKPGKPAAAEPGARGGKRQPQQQQDRQRQQQRGGGPKEQVKMVKPPKTSRRHKPDKEEIALDARTQKYLQLLRGTGETSKWTS